MSLSSSLLFILLFIICVIVAKTGHSVKRYRAFHCKWAFVQRKFIGGKLQIWQIGNARHVKIDNPPCP
jgi:hypothetical protein